MTKHDDFDDVGLKSLKKTGSVTERTAHGVGWIIAWRFINRILGLLSTLVLVRLLSPSDFGVVTLAMSFVHGLNALAEFGTENAIIRDDKPDRNLYDTAFTINALRGAGVAFILMTISIPLSSYFNSPHFSEVICVAAIVSLIGGLENIGVVDYRRYIAFEKEFWLKLVPRLFSVIVALTMAFLVHDYWALIVAILVNVILAVILSYIMHPYRPKFTLRAWDRIASYSTYLWLANVVDMISRLGMNTLISRLLGVPALGIYSVASEIASLPSTELVGPLSRAAFSGFSETRKHDDGSGYLLIRMVSAMLIITLPMGVGFSLIAAPLVNLTLGEKWLSAVPLLQIMGVGQSLVSLGQISKTLFAAQSWMKSLLRLTSLFAVLQLLLLVFVLPQYGLIGLAFIVASVSIITELTYFIVAIQRLHVPITAVVARIWRSIMATGVMVGSMVILGMGWGNIINLPSSNELLVIHLIEAVLVGISLYSSTIFILWYISGLPKGPENDFLILAEKLIQKTKIS